MLNLDLVNIQVTGWLYRQTLVRVDISRLFVSLSLFVGGPKSILFYLFWNSKASSKYIYTLNGVHIWVFFNTESLNERAPHFNDNILIMNVFINTLYFYKPTFMNKIFFAFKVAAF